MADETERRVEVLAKVWLAWFLVYMVFGARANMAGGTSFLAATVDHMDSLWVNLIFLNLPLQMVLALTALIFRRRRIGLGVAVANTTLILVHVVLSLFVEVAQ